MGCLGGRQTLRHCAFIVHTVRHPPVGYKRPCSCYFLPERGLLRMTHHYINMVQAACTMFKIVHNLISFPPSVFVPRPSICRSNVYFQPFARTNCFLHSFVPNTISSWNSLPTNVTNALTLPAFKALYTCT